LERLDDGLAVSGIRHGPDSRRPVRASGRLQTVERETRLELATRDERSSADQPDADGDLGRRRCGHLWFIAYLIFRHR